MKRLISQLNNVYYLTSSGNCENDILKSFDSNKSVCHILLDNRNQYIDENINDFKIFNKSIILNFNKPIDNYINQLNSSDILIVHGGDVLKIFDNIKKFKLDEYFKKMKNKIYVGISAGSMIMCKNSLFIKDDSEFKENILDMKLLGICNISRLDCHYDLMKLNPIYVKNLNLILDRIKDENYLLTNGSYIKIINNQKYFSGEIYFIKDGGIYEKTN